MSQIITTDLTILVAEDSRFFANKITASLREFIEDATIHRVEHLAEIDQYLSDYAIDVLILDLIFPEGTSLDKLDIIRKKYPSLFIIISSGQSKIRVAIKSMQAGADYYLVKDQGFDSDLLVALRNASKNIQTRRNLKHMVATVFDPQKYPMVVLKASEVGVSSVYRDFEEFPENVANLQQFIQKIGISLIVGIGQGDEYHTGVFHLPAADSQLYNLLDFAFLLDDPKAVDERLKTGYFHLVLFVPKSYQPMLPASSELTDLHDYIIDSLKDSSSLKPVTLREIKHHIFEYLRSLTVTERI